MARVTVILDPPRPKPVVRVDGKPVTRRPRIGLGLTLMPPPDPRKVAAKRQAIMTMYDDVLAGRSAHPLTTKHIRGCPSCRKRKRSLYRKALRRMTR